MNAAGARLRQRQSTCIAITDRSGRKAISSEQSIRSDQLPAGARRNTPRGQSPESSVNRPVANVATAEREPFGTSVINQE